MKMSWWMLGLVVLAAGGAGMAIQHQATDTPPAPAAIVDPFDKPAIVDPFDAPAANAGDVDQLDRINADLARDRQVEDDAKVMAKAIADENARRARGY